MRSYEMVKFLVEKRVTKTGLKVKTYIDDLFYQTGRKIEKGFSKKTDLAHNDFIPDLNYVATP